MPVDSQYQNLCLRVIFFAWNHISRSAGFCHVMSRKEEKTVTEVIQRRRQWDISQDKRADRTKVEQYLASSFFVLHVHFSCMAYNNARITQLVTAETRSPSQLFLFPCEIFRTILRSSSIPLNRRIIIGAVLYMVTESMIRTPVLFLFFSVPYSTSDLTNKSQITTWNSVIWRTQMNVSIVVTLKYVYHFFILLYPNDTSGNLGN